MMIREINITNFYSFEQATFKFQDQTNLLIGINGAGKSNFIKALKLLKESVAGIGLKKHLLDNLGGFDNVFCKKQKSNSDPKHIQLQFIFNGFEISKAGYGFNFTDDIIYTITIQKSAGLHNYYVQEKIETIKGFVYLEFNNGSGHLTEISSESSRKTNLVKYNDFDPQELVLKEVSDTDRYFALTTVKKAIKDIVVYDYFDTTPKSLIRKPMLPTSEKRLSPDGTNLPQILNTIKINHKAYYKRIAEMLQEVNPNFTGFDFNFIGGNIELMLEETELDSAVHVSNISDGTLRFLCLLSIFFNPERGRIVCIDEPEVGLHPDMILNIANAIKESATETNYIISTHSDNLLNYFEIENIRVFEKDATNCSSIHSFTSDQFQDWYETFALGQMWKQGDFGGVRYGS